MGMGASIHFNRLAMEISWCQKGDTSLTNSTYVHHLLRGSLVTGGWLNPHESYKSWDAWPWAFGAVKFWDFGYQNQIGFMDVFKRLHHVTSVDGSQKKKYVLQTGTLLYYNPLPPCTYLILNPQHIPYLKNPRSRWKLHKTLMFQDYWRPRLSCLNPKHF